MRIIRHLSSRGPAFAALQPDGSASALGGDIFSAQRVVGGPVKVGKLLAPVEPVYLPCIGLNYKQHATESRLPLPKHPVLFAKNPASIQHPGGTIQLPRVLPSVAVDYEAELAVVIGRRCKNVRREDAFDHILGYTCANDVSARDWQFEHGGGQWCQAKSFDTFCPLGPVLVTTDEIPDPNALRIRTRLNGETVQDSNTRDMIFDVPAIVEFLSAGKTLLPGTVILTGTPQGVGFARQPPLLLKAGDILEVEIEQIGTLTNAVVDEPVATGKPATGILSQT